MTNPAHVQHLLGLKADAHRHPWTAAELATLREMDAVHAFTSTIADRLGKTYGQVRWMRAQLAKFDLGAISGGPLEPNDAELSDRERNFRSDEAFQETMLVAIRAGLEHAPIGIFRDDSPPRFTPLIRVTPESPCRSSAGWLVELGET